MDKATSSIIKAHLDKAAKKIVAAKFLYRSGSYDDSVSRSYYAAFHAAQAVLLSAGLTTGTHQGLVNLFGLHFVKTGKFDRKFGKFLASLKDERETSDYEIYSTIDKKDCFVSLNEAGAFLQASRHYLSKLEQ